MTYRSNSLGDRRFHVDVTPRESSAVPWHRPRSWRYCGDGLPGRDMTPKQDRFVAEYLVDLNATQAALRAGYSARTAPQQGSRLLKNVDVQAAIAAQQTQQLEAVEVRIEDVLRDLKAIAHTDLRALSQQSGVPARWADKLKALE